MKIDGKPVASLSLDLDNQWSYMKTSGDAAWAAFPSYLDLAVPRILDFLAERKLEITVFIVGQDAERPENRAALAAIAAAGHEVGNHSHRHEPWLHLYPDAEIEAEIARAEAAIVEATGQAPHRLPRPRLQRLDSGTDDLETPRLSLRRLDLPDVPGPVGARLLLLHRRAQQGRAGAAQGPVRQHARRA